jgi:FAD:protein FMN transferase
VIAATEEVMGTVFSFLLEPGELAEREVGRALGEVREELHRLDRRFSPYRADSELSVWRHGGDGEPSALMSEVIELCESAFVLSGGYFNPWAMPGGFDPTGLVKGWAGERALAVLATWGVAEALVNAGGDVAVLDGRTYQVGVRHPAVADALCAVVPVTSAIASSGTYERPEHLVNPFGDDVAAVAATVVGGRLALADALATALAVGGGAVLPLLEEIEGVEGFFIDAGGSMIATSQMPFSAGPADPRLRATVESKR